MVQAKEEEQQEQEGGGEREEEEAKTLPLVIEKMASMQHKAF
jgi:hypothetical protein